jgi:hypothetical protein
MPHQLFEDAGGDDPRNAAALVAAAQLAYSPPDLGVPGFNAELGMDATFIGVGNTQVYVAGNPDHLLVAFRGSQSPTSIDGLKDWFLTNAANLLTVPEGRLGTDLAAAGVGAKFHKGFVGAIADVWEPLSAEVEARLKERDRPLWVTGHSLGGALALLAAWLFRRKFVAVHQVVTFGAPMVGNAEAAAAFARELPGKVVRYVNPPDPVPLLPMMSLVSTEYAHCDRLMALGAAEAANLVSYLREAVGDVAGGLLAGEIHDKVWAGIQGRVAAHLLADYRKLLGGG